MIIMTTTTKCAVYAESVTNKQRYKRRQSYRVTNIITDTDGAGFRGGRETWPRASHQYRASQPTIFLK